MKNKLLIAILGIIFCIECAALIRFGSDKAVPPLDTVAVNEVLHTVTADFYNMENHSNTTDLEYTVFDSKENIIFCTSENLCKSISEAIANRDTILHVETGTLVIDNNANISAIKHKNRVIAVMIAAMSVQTAVCIGYLLYIHFIVIKPFKKLKGFAERVAGGNLDIPLEMDRQNIFGAFTESFDIMRTELKRARIAEAKANKSKKELVAKLSHDIKTPVASIKAVSEVGLATAQNENQAKSFETIISKSDQINNLVTNLFTATLEELQELSVNPSDLESTVVLELICNADYLGKAKIPHIPECIIYADKLRLQQVFDNIFANSYKYANTDICVTVKSLEGTLCISVCDYGGGVSESELAVIKEKFRRGNNSSSIEGAGLGLYISDYFMGKMGGSLEISNENGGLKTTVILKLS